MLDNITTLIAAIILFAFGSGPVKVLPLLLNRYLDHSIYSLFFGKTFNFDGSFRKNNKEIKI